MNHVPHLPPSRSELLLAAASGFFLLAAVLPQWSVVAVACVALSAVCAALSAR